MISDPKNGSVGQGCQMPIYINELVEVHSTIEIRNHKKHWRAGIELTGRDGSLGNFVFHAFVDQGRQDVLQTKTSYISKNSVKNFGLVVNNVSPTKFNIKITNSNGLVKCFVENIDLGIPIEVDMQLTSILSLHAWADGKPYNIVFRDIRVKYK